MGMFVLLCISGKLRSRKLKIKTAGRFRASSFVMCTMNSLNCWSFWWDLMKSLRILANSSSFFFCFCSPALMAWIWAAATFMRS